MWAESLIGWAKGVVIALSLAIGCVWIELRCTLTLCITLRNVDIGISVAYLGIKQFMIVLTHLLVKLYCLHLLLITMQVDVHPIETMTSATSSRLVNVPSSASQTAVDALEGLFVVSAGEEHIGSVSVIVVEGDKSFGLVDGR